MLLKNWGCQGLVTTPRTTNNGFEGKVSAIIRACFFVASEGAMPLEMYAELGVALIRCSLRRYLAHASHLA
jgi:hypothetical protein